MINDLLHVANSIWIGADTPVALGCFLRAKHGEWDELARMEVRPSDYCNPHRFKVDNQCVGFLRKCKDLDTTVDREQAARAAFFDGEEKCCKTNARLSRYINNKGPFDLDDAMFFGLIAEVQKNVAYLVGSPPKTLDFKLGPGSTLSDPGMWSTVPHKFCSKPTVTTSALHVIPLWAQTAWGRNLESECEIRITDHDDWCCVDKTALTERGISKQPSINVASQLAVGRELRRRLARRGIDLDMLQTIHRRKAREASLSDVDATIDLRNASDTEAKRLVELLFPRGWFELMNSLRVPVTVLTFKYEGEKNDHESRVYLEKFSGMGNGYTFEMETITFLAICRAVCGRSNWERVSIYGDDIIVPADKATEVLLALRFFGFEPNPTKTFIRGPFRESCGGDYFDGVAVRPHYQKDEPSSPQDWISLANGLRRVWSDEGCFEPWILKAWHLCVEKIPLDVRGCRGPSDLGDIVLHDTSDRWQTYRKDSIRYIRAWLPYTYKVYGWSRFPAGTVLATALYGVQNVKFGIRTKVGHIKSHLAGVVPRDGVTGFRRAWVAYS